MELWFLFSMVGYICTKFRKNILDGFEVTERTKFQKAKFRKKCRWN